ncbi:MAG: hypothetical protein HY268_15690 [Deltaproteobacteria bacterium]|nr:hypothetical protein [Deltaproteobacteria bacterium]
MAVLSLLFEFSCWKGGSFERRYRDFQAMPLHINAHPDRVAELVGKFVLGLTNDAPFQ